MTLIFGANLQDCVYLACDTRLTTELQTGIIKCEDDFLKAHTFSQNMHCVTAGDANFASFLLKEIESSPLKNATYDNFENGIETLLKEKVGYYPWIQKYPAVVFIFAGT